MAQPTLAPRLLLALWLCCLVGRANPALSMTFVHPGALSSQAELDFVKTRIQAGDQPWRGEFEQLQRSNYATRGPHGLAHLNSQRDDATVSREDAAAAYTQALLWYFSGDTTYATHALAILDSWTHLQGFTSGAEQDRLQAGWVGSVFAQAAEIMRGYPGWRPAQIQSLQAMFKRAFYPQLNNASVWNGNVDLTQIDALLAIAVFNEDEPEFQAGLARLRARLPAYIYLTADGPLPHPIAGDGGNLPQFWFHPVRWVDGLTQETCRDNGHHAQFGLGSALHAAEVAWHQGVDVYTENQARFTAALELLATQFLACSMREVSSNPVAVSDRFDTWEVGYNHYHNRAGVALPNTQKLILEQIRPRSPRIIWNLAYETLTHANLPATPAGAPGGK